MSRVTNDLALTPASRRAFERLAADLERVLDTRLVALVAYGARESAAFASGVTADDLEALGALVETWHRDGLATPLVLTPDEFQRSLDAFPLEYQAILDRHALIVGREPFDGAAVAARDLRRACEVLAKSHLIHLRQGWLEAAGHADALARLLVGSAPPLRAVLANVARLLGAHAEGGEGIAAFAAGAIGMPADLVAAVLALEAHPERGRHLVGRLAEYLAAVERLWRFADTWPSA
jgi:hypothetical protein